METHIKQTEQRAYFAASNSRSGFCSYYEHCFRGRVDRLYCIKGGPGTGKSTLMRRVALEGARLGYRVEYYYCSSDADSLDGVLMFGKTDSIGLLDATLPHAFEPMLCGVQEHILDLGRFWRVERLREREADIVALNKQKSAAYRTAYRLLCGAGEVSDAIHATIAGCIREDKLESRARRMMRLADGQKMSGERRIALASCIGMQGRVMLDTYLRSCQRLCLIEDAYESAYLLMARVASLCGEAGLACRISHHPLTPDRIDALYFPGSDSSIVVCDTELLSQVMEQYDPCRILRMRRLFDDDTYHAARGELRRLTKIKELLLDETEQQMQKVSRAHFALEGIYGAAMDFEAENDFVRDLCATIFSK